MAHRQPRQNASLNASRGFEDHEQTSDALPMPYKANARKSSDAEKAEYERRRTIHYQKNPEYETRFNRLPPAIFDRAWKLIKPWLLPREIVIKGKDTQLKLSREEQVAMIVLVDLFVNAAKSGRGVTYNDVFDEVCRKYSDHFICSPAHQSRDMRPITVKNARRDLLSNHIDINKLWTIFRDLQIGGDFISTSCRKSKDPSAPLKVMFIKSHSVDDFVSLVTDHPKYFSSRSAGIRLKFAARAAARAIDPEDKDEFIESQEYCAEVPYNKVQLKTESINSIEIQSRSELLFDVDAFKNDFKGATNYGIDLKREIVQQYKLDPLISNKPRHIFQKKGNHPKKGTKWVKTEVWSERDKLVYYTSIVHGLTKTLEAQDAQAVDDLFQTKMKDICARPDAKEGENETARRRQHRRRKLHELATIHHRYEGFVVWLVACADRQVGSDQRSSSLFAKGEHEWRQVIFI